MDPITGVYPALVAGAPGQTVLKIKGWIVKN